MTRIERSVAAPSLRGDAIAIAIAFVPLTASAMVAFLDWYARTPLIALSLVCVICNVLLILRAHRLLGRATEIGALMFHFGMLFWFFGPALERALTGEQWMQRAALIGTDNRHAVLAFVAFSTLSFVFVFVYALIRASRLSALLARLAGPHGPPRDKRIVLVLVVATTVALGFYVAASGGFGAAVQNIMGSRAADTPWDSEGNYGTALTPFHNIASSVLTIVSTLSLLLLLERRFVGPWMMTIAVLGAISFVTVTVGSGTRSTMLQAMMPGLIIFYRDRLAGGRSQRLRATLLVVAGLLVAIGVAAFQRDYRETGELDSSVEFQIEDNDHFSLTTFVFAIMERGHEPTHDSAFVHIVSGPIPRVLWPGKPELDFIPIFSEYIWGVDIRQQGRNTMPSIVGQYLMSWGWLGVLEIGLWLAIILRVGDQAFRKLPPGAAGRFFYGVLVTYLFVAFRTVGFFFFMPVVVAFLLSRYIDRRSRPARARG